MAGHEDIVARGGFRVIEAEGDIFDASEESVLIHAVNCQGLWGSGIADAFKSKYPAAFEVYRLHCKEKSKLPGTCLLIPPQLEDYRSGLPIDKDGEARPKRRKVAAKPPAKKHWIGCLFTSYSYGKPTKYKAGKDSPEKILSNTRAALKDLREQVGTIDAKQVDPEQNGIANGKEVKDESSGKGAERDALADSHPQKTNAGVGLMLGTLFACKFNSGSFGVDWKETRALIEEAFDGSSRAMHVVSPPTKGR